ncbi:MAG TPA: exo-beta-N-acetylmuramidase NamZ domain-containing protein [Thermoanaerobaculia bacterium]|nr:exo-beta-N-acetylmuramidase NamZ domain-containing protein [Thermoanaerobaculia bacterium]
MIALVLAAAIARPADAGFSAARLDRIDGVVAEAIARGELPGAVVLVGRRDRIVFRRAYGSRAVLPSREPMTVDTVFDVASLTKPVATATSVLILVKRGRLALGDPVVKYIPEFAPDGGDREKVTVEQLLTHRAGLAPDDPINLYTGTPEEIFTRKYRQPLESPPGTRFRYSDVGYEVLGDLVRRVSGLPLDEFSEREIFRRLGMKDTHFRPLAATRFLGDRIGLADPARPPISRIAPTERRDDHWLRGEVHDPRAFVVGGVAGHAGLFSTADDLSRWCRMILAGGRLGSTRILSPLGVEAMTRPRFFGDGDLRALAFDVATAYSRNRGDLFPSGSFGHTGFTGTSLWIDPSSGVFVVFLSSRLHPDGKGDVNRLRGLVATIVASALAEDTRKPARRLAERAPIHREVLAGVDVLEAEGFRAIAGKRVGLVTNATGRARDGRSTVEVLVSEKAKKAGVKLVALFSPEHGIRSDADAPVADQVDPTTGLTIHSLYGERRRPTPEELEGLDALLLDVQDVGTRFYTYITTGGYLLPEVARARIPLVVLDRPDPITGHAIEGPVTDPDRLSFTAHHTIPVRYGMTPGELLTMVNDEQKAGARVEVVKLSGWSRDLWFDETGLEWVNPSPNMRSLTEATLYPGIGLLETTNLSIGRGTDTPFEVIGAPWLDGRRLAAVVSARKIPGVTFTPIHFTPASSTFGGERCGGVRLTVTDRDALRPVALGIEIAVALRDLYPVDWQRAKLISLLANRDTFERVERGEAADAIARSWEKGLEEFRRRRARFLLYPNR